MRIESSDTVTLFAYGNTYFYKNTFIERKILCKTIHLQIVEMEKMRTYIF